MDHLADFNPFTADPVNTLHFATLVSTNICNLSHTGALATSVLICLLSLYYKIVLMQNKNMKNVTNRQNCLFIYCLFFYYYVLCIMYYYYYYYYYCLLFINY